MKQITYGSLFSGAGGFDLGCDAAGWDCRWQVEWEPIPRSVLERHWPNVPKYRDVSDVNGAEIEPVDVITFGFPCQDMTMAHARRAGSAGGRKGMNGKRSVLFFEAARIIQEMRIATNGEFPKVAIAENVRGLLTANNREAMGLCLDSLANLGALAIEWRVLDARGFGVAQRRQRVFLAAIFDPRAASRGKLFYESSDSEADTPIALNIHKPSGEQHVARHRPDRIHGEAGLRKQQSDSISTIDTAFLGFQCQVDVGYIGTLLTTMQHAMYSPEIGMRRPTPLEAERMQGWPDNHTKWNAEGEEIKAVGRYKMCGNGVASPVAEYVANCVSRVLTDWEVPG